MEPPDQSLMKLRLYFDTSVFSAYYDDRVTDRRQQTEEFWTRLNEFEVATSDLAPQELAQTPDPDRRTALQALLQGFFMKNTEPLKTFCELL